MRLFGKLYTQLTAECVPTYVVGQNLSKFLIAGQVMNEEKVGFS